LRGALSAERGERVAEHLSACPRCAALLGSLRTEEAVVKAMGTQASEPGPPLGSVAQHLLDSLRGEPGPSDSQAAATAAPPVTPSPDPAPQATYAFLAPPRRADEIGRLGPYRVLRVLGQGGMGLVFHAEDIQLKRRVALKVMLPQRAGSSAARERFLREARSAAAIEHDHIVTIYQVGEDGGVPFLAMPLLQGGSLEDRLQRQGRLSVAEVLRIGREIGEGLAVAHEHGLMHRDIKPSNIWLEDRRAGSSPVPGTPAGQATCLSSGDRVKILDFGLARAVGEEMQLTEEGVLVGTIPYMAPEQANGQRVDVRCDLFSLGCVLYRMGTGVSPFTRANRAATLLAVTSAQPPPPRELNPELPVALSDLVMRLLAKDPAGRPPARVVAEVLAAAERDLVPREQAVPPASTHPHRDGDAPGPASSVRPSASRRRRITWAATLGAALLILAGVILYVQTDKGTLVVEIKDDAVQVIVEKGGKQVAVIDTRTGKDVRLDSGEYRLRVGEDRKDLELAPDHITLKRGDRAVATITSLLPHHGPVDKVWLEAVGSLPAQKQVKEVAAKLQELSRGFDGQVTPTIEAGKVIGLAFLADEVTDLTPLRALTGLKGLDCHGSAAGKGKLADLSPLKGLRLTFLACWWTNVEDLSSLKGMQLTHLNISGTKITELSLLQGMPLEFFWCDDTKVADLAPLKDMPLQGLFFANTQVADLTPLQGRPLRELGCDHTKVSDLTALKGLPLLRKLYCWDTPVADLSPLKGMQLTHLNVSGTKITELAPLQAMPLLTVLWCERTRVSELAPLKGMQLKDLRCSETAVSDLAPLQGMPLEVLNCDRTKVSDLAPLKGPRLKELYCWDTPVGDLSPLRGMQLTHLNLTGTKVTDLAPLQDMPLRELGLDQTKVSDLAPLKGMPLKKLFCWNTLVADLAPLKGMQLTHLNLSGTKITGLSLLQGMPLESFWCDDTKVSDLTPLKGMPLQGVFFANTQVADLSPLKGRHLAALNCFAVPVTDVSALQGMPLTTLWIDFKPERDGQVLRSLKTLEKINDKPAADFWKEVDAQQPKKP
jgi:serine/threonine protein kinase/Leucine-rich repeat (LRR) protein